ncbi:hypothetical protein M885DRAFT_612210 [Pelagophyceae sp. CCMP2097]|nr:hypothetical protein M885DRAFT_612210 [Pelagophyceae sp. CCMP2097]
MKAKELEEGEESAASERDEQSSDSARRRRAKGATRKHSSRSKHQRKRSPSPSSDESPRSSRRHRSKNEPRGDAAPPARGHSSGAALPRPRVFATAGSDAVAAEDDDAAPAPFAQRFTHRPDTGAADEPAARRQRLAIAISSRTTDALRLESSQSQHDSRAQPVDGGGVRRRNETARDARGVSPAEARRPPEEPRSGGGASGRASPGAGDALAELEGALLALLRRSPPTRAHQVELLALLQAHLEQAVQPSDRPRPRHGASEALQDRQLELLLDERQRRALSDVETHQLALLQQRRPRGPADDAADAPPAAGPQPPAAPRVILYAPPQPSAAGYSNPHLRCSKRGRGSYV